MPRGSRVQPVLSIPLRQGYHQVLSDLDLVRILQLVSIRIEDLHVLVGFAIEFLADLRQRIAGLHSVCLTSRRLRRLSSIRIDLQIDSDVFKGWVDRFYLIPEFV